MTKKPLDSSICNLVLLLFEFFRVVVGSEGEEEEVVVVGEEVVFLADHHLTGHLQAHIDHLQARIDHLQAHIDHRLGQNPHFLPTGKHQSQHLHFQLINLKGRHLNQHPIIPLHPKAPQKKLRLFNLDWYVFFHILYPFYLSLNFFFFIHTD